MLKITFIISLLLIGLFANNGEALAFKYHIDPTTKAVAQWERIFSKIKKMRKLGINNLSIDEKRVLKQYLISHAADSDNPTVPGM